MGTARERAHGPMSILTSLPTTTVEGRFFLVGLVTIGFLSTASDRNYVLLVLGLLLSVLVVSVVFSTWNLRGVSFVRSLPDAVIAGEPFTVRIRLENGRRWFPARGVLIKDALQSGRAGAESQCFAPVIPAGGNVTFVYTARIRRRGAYNITNALLLTRFPFGLFQKRVLARHPSRIVVYPRMEDIDSRQLPATRRAVVAPRLRAARRRGGDEFHSLREYRPGDDPRRITWRISARQGELVLKEMEQENRGRVAVLLSTSLAGIPRYHCAPALERAVSLAASLVRHFHRERRPFLFGAPGLVMEVFNRSEQVHVCCACLATVRGDSGCTPEALLAEVGARRLRGTDVLLVVPGQAEPSTRRSAGYRLHLIGAGTAAGRALMRGRRS